MISTTWFLIAQSNITYPVFVNINKSLEQTNKYTKTFCTILLFDICQIISHNFDNQEQTKFDLVLQSFILCGFFSKTVRLNTMNFILYQLFPNCSSLLQNQN